MTSTRPDVPTTAETWLGRAWLAVLGIPVLGFAAFALGYPLYDLFGYQPENADAPLWVDLVVTVPVLAIALAPCVAAVVCGRRAGRAGLLPAVVGALAGLGLTALSVGSLLG